MISVYPTLAETATAAGGNRRCVTGCYLYSSLAPSSPLPQREGARGRPNQGTNRSPIQFGVRFSDFGKGRIANLDDLKFIVDTGSTWRVIDRKVAERLLLNRRLARIMNYDRFMPTEWADVTQVHVGPIRAQGVQVMVMNLVKYSSFAKNIDGIIGLDLLSRSKKLIIDYNRRTLYFEPAENLTMSRSVPGDFLVTVVVQGLPFDCGYIPGRISCYTEIAFGSA